MSKNTIVAQPVAVTGTVLTLADANTDGSLCLNDGRTYLVVDNAGAVPTTVTVKAIGTCSQGTLHDAVVAVAAGAVKHIGPFPIKFFNNDSGLMDIAYSVAADVTVAAYK